MGTLSAAAAKTIGGALGATAVVPSPAEVAAAAAADTAKLFASKLNQVGGRGGRVCCSGEGCGWFPLVLSIVQRGSLR